jgi:transposase
MIAKGTECVTVCTARGVPHVNDRRVLNGILWVPRWRDLPENHGRYTCYSRFVRRRRGRRHRGS